MNSFYIYENWRATDKCVIHLANCRYCNFGKGTERGTKGEKNGRWHGKFNSYKETLEFSISLGRKEVAPCKVCNPNII